MEPIDQFLFQKLEEAQNNAEFQKTLDAYSNLDEKPQELIKALMALSLFIFPLVLIFIFYGMNASLRSELEVKKEALVLAQDIIKDKSGMQSAQRKFLAPAYVGSLNEMQNLVSAAISAAGVDPTKISVSNFEPIEREGRITQATLDMKFEGLPNNRLFSFLSILSERYKMKFEEVSLKKSPSSNLLEGIITLQYFSKNTSTGDF